MLRSWLLRTFLFLATVGATAQAEAATLGTVETLSITSTALGRKIPTAIYVPDGIAPARGWPVIYLLHGLAGSETDWLRFGRIDSVLERLTAQKLISPKIVVMPQAGSSWYVDSRKVDGPGDYETAIMNDVRSFIESRYPARKDRQGRAIAGLSMGGYGALRLALGHASMFCAVAALSPALWQNVPASELDMPAEQIALLGKSSYFHQLDSTTVVTGIDSPPAGPHFAGAFGSPFDPRLFNASNVFTILAKSRSPQPMPQVYVSVGDHDGHQLVRGAMALYQTLAARGHPPALRISDGDHDWSFWRAATPDALIFLDRACARPIGGMN